MKIRTFHLIPWLATAAVLVLGACDTETENPLKPESMWTQLPASRAQRPSVVAHRAPDFSLPDVNPNSKTHDQPVSPRQHLGRISAWYFGHAT